MNLELVYLILSRDFSKSGQPMGFRRIIKNHGSLPDFKKALSKIRKSEIETGFLDFASKFFKIIRALKPTTNISLWNQFNATKTIRLFLPITYMGFSSNLPGFQGSPSSLA